MLNNKAFFFDRDGVLNEAVIIKKKPYPPNNIHELILEKFAENIIIFLKKLNYKIFVFTNQPDVTRKTTKKNEVIKINNFIKKKFDIDDLFVCYCSKDTCFRRKPNPGMIYDAKKKWNIDLRNSYVVGDRYKDIKAGKNAGVKTIFLDKKYNEKKLAKPDFVIKSLNEIKKILEYEHEKFKNKNIC
jgi:D-glycero-D-manno-heptose 1,7-bisphosphate phosphatase|tara:strand:+ start:153 stop:710 length:558 start_codon:yes stop_codon:yes gene_type:complete